MPATFEAQGLLTFTIAILVYFAGAGLNGLIAPLRRWNIPEAETGGLLVATSSPTPFPWSCGARPGRRAHPLWC